MMNLSSCQQFIQFHFRFQLQDRLVDSLKLLSQLPDSFVREVSDRLACGMAIILRVSNHKVLKLHEWELLGNLLGRGTYYEKSWRYALDGIASFTEQFICPSSSDSVDENGEKVVPLQGVTVLTDILLNFVSGGFPKGTALIDALSCLQRLCLSFMFQSQPPDQVSFTSSALPLDLWKRIVATFGSNIEQAT